MREKIFNFMNLCLPGIKDYPSGPILKFYFEIESRNRDKKAVFFCVHRVTDLYNDEWELKSDWFCLLLEGKIFLLRDETTNYDQEVDVNKTGYGFKYDFEREEATICFSIKSKSGMNSRSLVTLDIPKSKWQLIECLLKVTEIPTGNDKEEMRQLLVGEKFPLEIGDFHHCIAHRDDNGILIPKKDVIETLKKSGKEECADYFSKQNDYIHFNSGCYKLL